ncbi:hypothetical protein V1517DRAFT_319565 [Lipomyces orientalis]|uniref:Uncharacterized protein n=1 Tax=Lipomyces orientalis TaxID=1233043 RepID=A0ACC3TRR3_9ASCO
MVSLSDVRAALVRLPSLAAGKRRRSLLVWIALTVVFLAAARFAVPTGSSIEYDSYYLSPAANWNGTVEPSVRALAGRAHNASLGFGEIVYISLPARTDRQDAMNLLASIHGLDVHLIPGVDGDTVHPKSVPDGGSSLRPPELGCWRAHADAWRRMLASRQETMLILEDDADFDVHIHDIFERISTQMQHNRLRVAPPTEREIEAAPYGLDWDVMYLGQCSDYASPRRDLAQAFSDPDAPQRAITHEHFVGMLQSLGVYGKAIGKTRTISPSFGPVCTLAYAITRRGAQRLLLNFSYLGLSSAIDVDMLNKLQTGVIRGYTITPPPFNQFQLNNEKDSDTKVQLSPEELEKQKKEKEKTEKDIGNLAGTSLNIRNSARHAMLVNLDRHNWEDYERVMPMPSKQATKTQILAADESDEPVPQFTGTPEEGKAASQKAGAAPLEEVTDSSSETPANESAEDSSSSSTESESEEAPADKPAEQTGAGEPEGDERDASLKQNEESTADQETAVTTDETTESSAEGTTPGEDAVEESTSDEQEKNTEGEDAPLEAPGIET